MKVELDCRPRTNNSDVVAIIRLYPETNEEVSKLEWMFECMKQPQVNNTHSKYVKAEVIRNIGCIDGGFHHAVVYKYPEATVTPEHTGGGMLV